MRRFSTCSTFYRSKLIYNIRSYDINKKSYCSSREGIEELERVILNYHKKEESNFLGRKKEYENFIRQVLKDRCDDFKTDKIFLSSLEDIDETFLINNKDMESIKDYVEKRNKDDIIFKDKNKLYEYIEKINIKSEIMKIIAMCGIRISLNILIFYMYDIILKLIKCLHYYDKDIIKYDSIKDKDKYYKIGQYYYYYYYNQDNNNVDDNKNGKDKKEKSGPFLFLKLYKILSNILYTTCENSMQTYNKKYIYFKEEIINKYNSIDDIIYKVPAFLNISFLFYYINICLYIDPSRKSKNMCLQNLNNYLNCIADDEINISREDFNYLVLSMRLYFLFFSYNDILNILNEGSKHFLSTLVLIPNNNNDNKNNIHSIQMDDNINYVYIINYLNKNQKYIENTKITLFPFHFYLSSLKNKIIYILEKNDHFYLNDSNVLRSYNFWSYFIAQKENFKLLSLCTRNEYADLFNDQTRDSVLSKYVNKDYLYDFNQRMEYKVEQTNI
ncbi:hypothetical protein PFAG_02097 [Plasmodium falciparum Santa Lucia]|uniref:RAP domain-containing protein n=9 Tax=Plasmodium falciparum TaxID=5833 RepID=Q8IB39_PLAF7|nr:conserved Plasmodium protein, unknown function [Plasmodium falciparum 3D7]ETW37108.1 hypothetical protein PFTANZ_02221 [Plasmodium falciparum Tanzania (2000708)]ETW43352.1 hypothetical protein PFNF135_02265 [Plasmodium falciparum NF135/5.C10]ETW62008.1 hypothetical protein PFMC_02109 [Plasmodium falciparum CAMP/Malaysia]EUR72982.1 hypothetical protein PFBG_02183 [Plasmodium falciparum 7G8]EUT87274.1 hypothetical protein PFAG_02097 [Plasmodium falciparum Santa Lucia]EWC77073.1 hypothetical |eukprot:XP_001349321.1 conserved Plasmodium protein, unknown function [Plasmodium falciparum 3D7]